MRSNYKFTEKNGIYFLTSTIIEWLPVFTQKTYFEILINSIRFCQNSKNLMIFAFVIIDNHFHLVASAPELSSTIASLKMYTAKSIIEQLNKDNKFWLLNQLEFHKKLHKTKSHHQVWQEGSHPQLITLEEMLVQKIEYIHENPAKRGLVDLPEHWRYSSATNYINNDQSILKIEPLQDIL